MSANKDNIERFFEDLSNILIFTIFNRDIQAFDYIEQNINGILSSAREKIHDHIEGQVEDEL